MMKAIMDTTNILKPNFRLDSKNNKIKPIRKLIKLNIDTTIPNPTKNSSILIYLMIKNYCKARTKTDNKTY